MEAPEDVLGDPAERKRKRKRERLDAFQVNIYHNYVKTQVKAAVTNAQFKVHQILSEGPYMLLKLAKAHKGTLLIQSISALKSCCITKSISLGKAFEISDVYIQGFLRDWQDRGQRITCLQTATKIIKGSTPTMWPNSGDAPPRNVIP